MSSPSITSFKGLNNVSDSLRLGLGWLTTANNVNISDTGALSKRAGYSQAQAGAFSSAYSTLDFQRMYLVVGTALKNFVGDTLATLTSTATMHWCEVNDQVFYNNGTDSGIIRPDHSILPWRESTLADETFYGADGEKQNNLLDPLPLGTTLIQHWRGRIYAAQYMPSEAQTVIWFSQPLGYHLFNLDTDFFILPGKVTMLAPTDAALIVGTDVAIHAYDAEKLATLAGYGVVPGQHWADDDKRILFWSTRGLCAALPFTNLTEKQVSVAPGVAAGGALIQQGGQRRYVVAIQQGGAAFNAH